MLQSAIVLFVVFLYNEEYCISTLHQHSWNMQSIMSLLQLATPTSQLFIVGILKSSQSKLIAFQSHYLSLQV